MRIYDELMEYVLDGDSYFKIKHIPKAIYVFFLIWPIILIILVLEYISDIKLCKVKKENERNRD